MSTHRELLEPIIREMLQVGPDNHVTSQDIADEATRRTGVKFTAAQVSAVRVRIGMGYRQMIERESASKYARQIEEAARQIREEYGL